MSPAGWGTILRLGVVLFVALLIGLIIGRTAAVLAMVLAIYLTAQIVNLLRVEYWLSHRRIEAAPDMRGSWAEVVAIVGRIDRRKQYHKAHVTDLLREFRRLTHAMPEGAVLLGPEHEILWFNPRVSAWLGLRRKRDLGFRIENLVRHPDFVDYLRTGLPAEGVVIQGAGGDRSRWFSFHLVRTDEKLRQLLIVRDVTQEHRLASMRKDFVANASHELCSPLTVISGYLDTLADDEALDPAWRPPVMEMRRQAVRMQTIIDDLLELSKLESNDNRPEDRPVDIAAMLTLMRRDLMAQEHHPRELTLRLDSDAWLEGAESDIHSVVANLLSNAVKYTPPEGTVELRWWTDELGGHLAVRDTGAGIAAEHLPRLTERFYRVDSGRSRELGGSGLGLAIVKHALQRHGAVLEVQSEEGRGSTFTCHFPVQRVLPAPVQTRGAKQDS
ncbi:two-component system, OmpR family, phosphate regulon sensor histidine kinase PhoR [Steroidobacter denitrificans]|uniref:Phosphate regulon sensor protein PhoR n=1 Tax=Steroidobacter denitrificans TaxID=465721 RepID=A0A127FAC7_STEDE|nr:two-component system, OmpR family, phosphate regulon sensor histidine kinase PhoR [Steroidobacter denitrificans]